MPFAPTPEQKTAIDARGGSILLSAAAGSGKTAVLTERAVSRMLDPADPVPADRLLIVTFTRAAAAEMKERIVRRLALHLAEHPGDDAARRQRTLVERAQIGTIDSLCSEILHQNFQLAGLPASFRVGDDNELDAMREDAASAVLEEAYRDADPVFLSLSQLLSSSRNDLGLSEAVLKTLSFARSHPFYRRWMEEKLAVYRNFSEPDGSVWADILFAYGEELADFAVQQLTDGLIRLESDVECAGYAPAFRSDLAAAKAVRQAARDHDWDGCVSAVSSYRAERLGAARKADPVRREALKAMRNQAKEILSVTLPEKVFCASRAEFCEDVADLLPKIECLFSLVGQVDDRLQSEKIAQGILDYTDLEQMACALLVDENGGRTPLAIEYNTRFDEVMVDEFQDVNEVQNSILTALARDDNFFCVGDVKQSIYRFRMAQPKLFLERAAACHPYDGTHFPAVLRLNGSFRTAPAVTALVNETFTALMNEEIGELVYDAREALVPLATFAPDVEQGADLCLIADSDEEDGPAEPAWVAGEIVRLLREGTVTENGAARPVRPRDIAILLRSPSTRGSYYRQALEQAGISAAIAEESGFLGAPEIVSVLNVLYALANPLRDVELLGAMTSPLFGFTDDELAALRVCTPTGHLWSAVTAAAPNDAHAAQFAAQMEHLRRRSLTSAPSDLIGELLRMTGFDVLCSSMKDGARRSGNLALLVRYADESCSSGAPTLEGFLRRVTRLREQKKDLTAASLGEGADSVTISSIHKSKGLEWPIVFVCETAKPHSFARNDMTEPTILHSELGFACVRRNPEKKRQFVTVPLAAVRTEAQRGFLSEELRVLYVAMTRAKERLYLTACVRDPQKRLDGAAALTDGRDTLPTAQVRAGKTFLDWLLPAFSLRHDLSALAESGEREGGLRVFAGEAAAPAAIVSTEEEKTPRVDETLLARLRTQTSYAYPHRQATELPAKIAVSEISHDDASRYFTTRPDFLSAEGLTGTKRGTAVHAYLQFCDFAAAKRDPAAELSRMRETGILTAPQADAVDLAQIERFFASPLGSRIFSADRVLREFRFMAPAAVSPAAAHYALPDGEATMLQGVADCILIEGDHAVLIDYKTDRVKDADQLVRRYRKQLVLYRDMLAGVLGVPVAACALYSFALGETIWVE